MNDTKKGMLFIMMAAFFFASMNVFVKLSGDLSSIQKSFFRNLIAALFAFIILIKSKEGFTYQKKDVPMLLLRSTFGTRKSKYDSKSNSCDCFYRKFICN